MKAAAKVVIVAAVLAFEGSPLAAQPRSDAARVAVIEKELDQRHEAIDEAAKRIAAGSNIRATLDALIGQFPADFKEAIERRVKVRIEQLTDDNSRHRKASVQIDGELFDMAGAVLLMSTGSYAQMTATFTEGSPVTEEVNAIGQSLLRGAVKPDMGMLRRLREIYARYIKEEAARKAAAQGDTTRPEN